MVSFYDSVENRIIVPGKLVYTRYVQWVTNFFSVIMFYEPLSNLMYRITTKKVVYVDATGNIVRKPKCCNNVYDCKRIFLYAGVMKVNDTMYPIMEVLSGAHDIEAIKNWLGFVYNAMEKLFYKRKRLLVDMFITDWSFVLITNSIM